MATRQYIGARYTPKFSGTYDNTQAYEALEVVDNGSGTTYIARKPVPPNTPLTNTEYWLVYGSSSGAILDLQGRVAAIEETDIPAINQDISNINGSILAMGGQIADAESDIVDLESDVSSLKTQHKIGFITDSYGTVDTNWMTNIADRINLSLAYVATASRGFVHAAEGGTFYNSLDNLPSGIYDYLITYGGQNDINENYSAIYSAVASYISKAKTAYPNTKIIIVGPQTSLATAFGSDSKDLGVCEDAMKDACAAEGIAYCNPSVWLLAAKGSFSANYRSDRSHPSASGYAVITSKMLSLITGNRYDGLVKMLGLSAYANPQIIKNLVYYTAVDGDKLHIQGTFDLNANVTNDTEYIIMQVSNEMYTYMAIASEQAYMKVYKNTSNKFEPCGMTRPAGSSGNRQYRWKPTEDCSANTSFFFEGDIYINMRQN